MDFSRNLCSTSHLINFDKVIDNVPCNVFDEMNVVMNYLYTRDKILYTLQEIWPVKALSLDI